MVPTRRVAAPSGQMGVGVERDHVPDGGGDAGRAAPASA